VTALSLLSQMPAIYEMASQGSLPSAMDLRARRFADRASTLWVRSTGRIL